MSTVSSDDAPVKARRGPLQAEVRASLNEATLQVSLLQRQVGAHLGLKDVDLECFNLIQADGPLSPSELAGRAGLHRSTVTGVVDRLEDGGWVVRERDPQDRRLVHVRALDDRQGELFALLSGMTTAMGKVIGNFSTSELAVIADFLTRTADAGRAAADELGR